VEWHEGSLRVSASAILKLPEAVLGLVDGDLATLGAPRPRIGLRNRSTTSIVPLPSAAEVTPTASGWRVTVSADADFGSGARGLPKGAHQVVLEAPGLPGNPLLALRRGGLHLPAVVGDLLVTARHEAKAGLHVDVGAAKQSLLRHLDPAGGRIEESMTGSALTIPTPEIHVWPPERRGEPVPGKVLLGGLPFPAELTLNPPMVHCLVSGMPGSVAIQTRFGTGAATQSGCELRVAPDGIYTVAPLSTAETSGVSTLVASGVVPAKKAPRKGTATAKPARSANTAKPAKPAPQPGALRVAWRRLPTPVKDRLRGPAKRLIGS
jgi:hypothetical protein